MISGILPVDKPSGWTSHDIVAHIRRVARQKRVGHAGTLDPLATGVLLLVLGEATKLSSYLLNAPKEYCAEVVLGVTTATDDAEAPPRTCVDASHISRLDVERTLPKFLGALDQIPPAYAAVRHQGQKLYKLARKGESVQPDPRRVMVYALEIEWWKPPRVGLYIRCGSGTYIRSLARDLGAALEVGGYLHALRRVAIGGTTASDCVPLDRLSSIKSIEAAALPPDYAVSGWPAVVLDAKDEAFIRTGRAVTTRDGIAGQLRIYDTSGTLIALGEADAGVIKPFRVFAGR